MIHTKRLMVVVIGATAGRVGLLEDNGSSNQQITSFELRTDRVEPPFAVHQVKQVESWLRAMASTATLPIIDSAVLSRVPLAFPSKPEQQSIVGYIESETSTVDAAVDRTRREIELIREYRTRLISDVVTGKLDVRGVELPDAGEESQGALESVVAEGSPDAEEALNAEL